MRTSGVKKEKLPIKNDEKSSLVAEEGLFHDPFLGCLTPKNPSHQGFFFVAETDQISNLDLIKDLDKIIRLVEFLNLEEGSAC